MRYIIYILLGLFVFCGTSNNTYAQFWKKKNGTASAKRGGGSSGGNTKDSFSGKSKKGPNVYSSKPPRTKSKSKLYSHSVSKKRLKKNNGSGFSSSKRRYKSVNTKPKGKGTVAPNSSSGGRKSGKGRKKE